MPDQKASGVISGAISTITFGLIGTALFSVLLQVDGRIDLYNNLSLDSASKMQNYVVILLSWALGGIIAGIRTKDNIKGFLSGFFGAFIGSLFILLYYLSTLTEDLLTNFDAVFNSIQSTVPAFFIGMVGIMLAASFSGLIAGRVTTEKSKPKPIAKSKLKTWSNKDKWKCTKCGEDIPPGKMNCPNCGAGVIQ
jgi:hypothetical protein